MTSQPYVGITGPVSKEEVKSIMKEFREAGFLGRHMSNITHAPMIGFLVSYKTLNSQSTANRRYPEIDKLPELLGEADARFLTMLHYNSREMQTLSGQLIQLFSGFYETGLCHAVQLNIVWPDIRELAKTKMRMPDLKVVFQANEKVMAGRSPSEISTSIREYRDLIDYILIDPSGGKGREFDLEHSVEVAKELREKLPSITLGFAGGFTGENVISRVTSLKEIMGNEDFCIDAEGGLRDKITQEYGDDILNIGKVKNYLKNAAEVLR